MRAVLVTAAAATATAILVVGCGVVASPVVPASAVRHRAVARLVVTRTSDFRVPGGDIGQPAPAADGDVLLPVAARGSGRLSAVRMLRPDGQDRVVATTSSRHAQIESTAYAAGWVAWVDQLRVGQNIGDGDPKPWRLMARNPATGRVRTLDSGTAAPGSSPPELTGDGDTVYWTEPDGASRSKIMTWSPTDTSPPAPVARRLKMSSSPSVSGDAIVYAGPGADGSRDTSDCYLLSAHPQGRQEPRVLTTTGLVQSCATDGSRLVFELSHPPRPEGDHRGPPLANPWQVRTKALASSASAAGTKLEQGFLPGEGPVVGGAFAAFTVFAHPPLEVVGLDSAASARFVGTRTNEVRYLAARGGDLFAVSQDDDSHVYATFFTVH